MTIRKRTSAIIALKHHTESAVLNALRCGVTIGTIEQVIRQVAVEAASVAVASGKPVRGAKPACRSSSVLAAVSGLSRKETSRLMKEINCNEPPLFRTGPVHRIIMEWQRRIAVRGDIPSWVTKAEFYALARPVAHDIPPRAVLDAMIALGLVVEYSHPPRRQSTEPLYALTRRADAYKNGAAGGVI